MLVGFKGIAPLCVHNPCKVMMRINRAGRFVKLAHAWAGLASTTGVARFQ